MILAYVVLFVHWPAWATIAAILAGAGVVWKFGEGLLSIVKKWNEARAARIKVRQAQIAFRHTEQEIEDKNREDAIRLALRKIEQMEFELQQKPGYFNSRLTPVVPGPGEDPQIVAEAWRRFKLKRDEQDNMNWRKK